MEAEEISVKAGVYDEIAASISLRRIAHRLCSFYAFPDCCKTDEKAGCFWTEASSSKIKFEEAKRICESNLSSPAVIRSEAMYERVLNDIRKKGISGKTFWTGMTLNTQVRYFNSGKKQSIDHLIAIKVVLNSI